MRKFVPIHYLNDKNEQTCREAQYINHMWIKNFMLVTRFAGLNLNRCIRTFHGCTLWLVSLMFIVCCCIITPACSAAMSCFILMCAMRLVLCLYCFPHTGHVGISAVMPCSAAMWSCSSMRRRKPFPHAEQWSGKIRWWDWRMCVRALWWCMNDLLHSVHRYGRSSSFDWNTPNNKPFITTTSLEPLTNISA